MDDWCIKVCDLWQNEEGIIESEDERSSFEPEDNQAQVGHEILCESILRYCLLHLSFNNHIEHVVNKISRKLCS